MFEAVGIALYPMRWQWLVSKYSVHGLLVAVWVLIADTAATALWCVNPYPLPEAIAEWGIWLPMALAGLLVQVSCVALQIACMTTIVARAPALDDSNNRVGWRQQVRALAGTGDSQFVIVAFVGMCSGASLVRHSPNVTILAGAIVPLVASLIALRGLLESVQSAKPYVDRPHLRDPAVGDGYIANSRIIKRYGHIWYDPAQLQTVSVAQAYASMASQQRCNIYAGNATALAAASLLNFMLPHSTGPLLMVRIVLTFGALCIALLAADRARRLGELRDQYIDRVSDLEGDA